MKTLILRSGWHKEVEYHCARCNKKFKALVSRFSGTVVKGGHHITSIHPYWLCPECKKIIDKEETFDKFVWNEIKAFSGQLMKKYIDNIPKRGHEWVTMEGDKAIYDLLNHLSFRWDKACEDPNDSNLISVALLCGMVVRKRMQMKVMEKNNTSLKELIEYIASLELPE